MAKKRSAGTETKTGFLLKVLTKNPDLDHRQVNRLWTRERSCRVRSAMLCSIRSGQSWGSKRSGSGSRRGNQQPQSSQQETTTDPLVEAAQNNLPHILALYKLFEDKRPVMLFDLQSQKIYAYPYMEYKANLNERSQAILERQYQEAITENKIVVFVRDNESQRLTSMVLDKE